MKDLLISGLADETISGLADGIQVLMFEKRIEFPIAKLSLQLRA